MEQQVCTDPSSLNGREFYELAAKYWDNVPATLDGMLGGFGYISQTDISGSMRFLQCLFKIRPSLEHKRALDCGAGIGRITNNLLTKHFQTVDLVEQNQKFLERAKTYLKCCSSKVGNFYSVGLQDFCPESNNYDVIWCQWVLGHLNDNDLIQFFKNCRNGLTKNGLLIVKENVAGTNKIEIDQVDSSVTRPRADLLEAFQTAGFKCIKEEKQNHMPRGLFAVYMFALEPCDNKN